MAKRQQIDRKLLPPFQYCGIHGKVRSCECIDERDAQLVQNEIILTKRLKKKMQKRINELSKVSISNTYSMVRLDELQTIMNEVFGTEIPSYSLSTGE